MRAWTLSTRGPPFALRETQAGARRVFPPSPPLAVAAFGAAHRARGLSTPDPEDPAVPATHPVPTVPSPPHRDRASVSGASWWRAEEHARSVPCARDTDRSRSAGRACPPMSHRRRSLRMHAQARSRSCAARLGAGNRNECALRSGGAADGAPAIATRFARWAEARGPLAPVPDAVAVTAPAARPRRARPRIRRRPGTSRGRRRVGGRTCPCCRCPRTGRRARRSRRSLSP